VTFLKQKVDTSDLTDVFAYLCGMNICKIKVFRGKEEKLKIFFPHMEIAIVLSMKCLHYLKEIQKV